MPFGSRKIQIEVRLKQKSSVTLEFVVTRALYQYRQKILPLYFFLDHSVWDGLIDPDLGIYRNAKDCPFEVCMRLKEDWE